MAIDWPRVSRAMAELRRIAREHPELVSNEATDPAAWEHILEEDEAMATKQVAVRLEAELIAALDAFAAQLAEGQPGVKFNRADAIRVLCMRGLEAAGIDVGQPRGKRGKR